MKNFTILDNANRTEENIVTNAPADIVAGLARSIATATKGVNFIKILIETLIGCGYDAVNARELFA